MKRNSYKIMIVAGEESGDLHAAKLVKALEETADSDVNFFGAAGKRMREAGVDAIVESDHLSIVGLLEIGRALPMFMGIFAKLNRAALERRPDVVILVDFPEFNLKLAKTLSKAGLKIVYYISPQLWAWRRYRIRTIRKSVDLVISILPFEKSWYAEHGVDHVEYVGSPLAREVHPTMDKAEFCKLHDLIEDRPLIALLPGSRHKEITRILPVMLETASKMSGTDSTLQFIIATASDRNRHDVEAVIKETRTKGSSAQPEKLITVQGETFNCLRAADAAAVASGTATLETGIIGTPMAIVYKTSGLNYKLLRPLIDVEHFGLINLIAGDRIARELIQDGFTAETLAQELFRLLEAGENKKERGRLKVATDKLGQGGASKRAAALILKLIERSL